MQFWFYSSNRFDTQRLSAWRVGGANASRPVTHTYILVSIISSLQLASSLGSGTQAKVADITKLCKYRGKYPFRVAFRDS